MKPKPESNKNVHIIIGAMAAAFIVWAFYYVDFEKNTSQGEIKEIRSSDYLTAPPGQLVAGFPDILTLNGKTEIVQSHETKSTNSTVMRTVLFTSSKAPLENYDFYSNWAADFGWQIVKESGRESRVLNLFMKKNTEEISMMIDVQRITIAYVTK